ncbi:hypothetical protein HanPSC8_Chr05g0193691 [Helianthus annuus]|nr:hypothetical protein HanPSC8_Chr05g0193691 [Helianthus annuus]
MGGNSARQVPGTSSLAVTKLLQFTWAGIVSGKCLALRHWLSLGGESWKLQFYPRLQMGQESAP